MGIHRVHKRPDYVEKYDNEENTEIRHINGRWYLYRIDKIQLGDSKKYKIKSVILGLITPKGLEESIARKKEKRIEVEEKLNETKMNSEANEAINNDSLCSDTLEVGASNYFYRKSTILRSRLKKYFPDMWQFIYVTHLLRLIYEPKFKRLKTHYQYSIICKVFPFLDFNPISVSKNVGELGKKREVIREFMLEDLKNDDRYLLVDGHRLITASKKRDLPELGYDSKHRYKPQINLLYIFSLGEDLSYPAYYKQYSGSTIDVVAFSDILVDAHIKGENIIIVTDKGVCSSEDMDIIEKSCLQYIVPLDRNNKYVKNKIPENPVDYEKAFTYHGRPIFYKEILIEEENFRIFLFCDIKLFYEECLTNVTKLEKDYIKIDNQINKELKNRNRNRGKLTDSELKNLKSIEVKDLFENKKSIGTITIKSTANNIDGQQTYCIWKTRQAIEESFKMYDKTLDFDVSHMQDDIAYEGWLFLNHLSSITAMSCIDELCKLNLLKQFSLNDLRYRLRKVTADLIDGKWIVKPVKSEVRLLCQKLNFDISDLSIFGLLDQS